MKHLRLFLCAALIVSATGFSASSPVDDRWRSTRVEDPRQHLRLESKQYPYREWVEEILQELDLRAGDVVVDIGAGDGWWAERMCERVGSDGLIYATEIEAKKVERLERRFADTPQVRPCLTPTDGTNLPRDSCDLAFFSQVYHHLEEEDRVDYLVHLREVVKPLGRLAIIEKDTALPSRSSGHGTTINSLSRDAEAAGWVLVRYELLPRTHHYLALLVKKDLFSAEPDSKAKKKRTVVM